VAAILAVDESLKDKDYLMASVQKLIDERERLVAQLKTINWLTSTRRNRILFSAG